MGNYLKIEKEINSVKEWNMEAGNELHNQMSHAQNATWTREELSEYIKSDNDVADQYYSVGDQQHDEIRNIQDSIISFYGEEENKPKRYTVRLGDDTIGTIDSDTIDGQSAEAFMGETVSVHLHDENGNNIEAQGRLVEVLEEQEY